MTLIAGPCVIEDEALVRDVAQTLKSLTQELPVNFYFKASFDKANRSSIDSFRGPGLKEGLGILAKVKQDVGVSLLTDFHTPDQAIPVSEVVDYLQIPAFLCRQTDLIVAGAKAALKNNCRLNIKKGQFLAPWDCANIVNKAKAIETEATSPPVREWLTLTERGSSFGYNRLVVDMIGFSEMQKFDVPIIYDATHSVQLPGAAGGGTSTGGMREHITTLARAAMAAGADGLFFECHPNPSQAKSDGANALALDDVGPLLKELIQIRTLISGLGALSGKL